MKKTPAVFHQLALGILEQIRLQEISIFLFLSTGKHHHIDFYPPHKQDTLPSILCSEKFKSSNILTNFWTQHDTCSHSNISTKGKNKRKFLDFNVFTKHTRSLLELIFQTTKQLHMRIQRTINTVYVCDLGIHFQSTDKSQCY